VVAALLRRIDAPTERGDYIAPILALVARLLPGNAHVFEAAASPGAGGAKRGGDSMANRT